LLSLAHERKEWQMNSPPDYPDGLTRAVIDALVAEVDALARPVHRVPPLFADRDAALRRERRHAHRALARVTRAVLVAAEGEEAA
jgi:hypothetical protein